MSTKRQVNKQNLTQYCKPIDTYQGKPHCHILYPTLNNIHISPMKSKSRTKPVRNKNWNVTLIISILSLLIMVTALVFQIHDSHKKRGSQALMMNASGTVGENLNTSGSGNVGGQHTIGGNGNIGSGNVMQSGSTSPMPEK